MITILYGPETYLIHHYEKAFWSKSDNEMDKSRFDSFEDAFSFLTATSFFGGVRRAIVNVPNLKALDTSIFWAYAQMTADGSTNSQLMVVLDMTSVSTTTKLYKKISSFATIKECGKLKGKQFMDFFESILQEQDCKMLPDAKKVFLERMNYENHPDIGLITIENEIGILKHLENPVSVATVEEHSFDYRKGDCFRLVPHIVACDAEALFLELERLKKESDFQTINALSAIFREYRIAYKASCGFTTKDMGVWAVNLKYCPAHVIQNGLSVITESIRNIKTGVFTEDDAMKYTCTKLLQDMVEFKNK